MCEFIQTVGEIVHKRILLMVAPIAMLIWTVTTLKKDWQPKGRNIANLQMPDQILWIYLGLAVLAALACFIHYKIRTQKEQAQTAKKRN